MQQIEVVITNLQKKIKVEKGTSLLQIAQQHEAELGFKPLEATLNNVSHPLSSEIFNPSQVSFVGITSENGSRTYLRTLCMVMAKALDELFPTRELYLEHSECNGRFFTISGTPEFSDENLAALKERVQQLAAENLPIVREVLPTEEVIAYFKARNNQHVVDVLETCGQLYVPIHRIGDFIDTYHGALAPSTGSIYLFDIIRYMEGFLIRVPDKNNPDVLAPYNEQRKMHEVIRMQDELNAMLDLPFVGELNKAIERGETAKIVMVSEAVQEKQIASIAEQIAFRYQKGVRLVLISGPSSSGKTTFTKRLNTQLITCFIKPYIISLDDYFLNREDTPRSPDGDYDFESLHALDLDTFNKDMQRLLAGETVEIPTYNFKTGLREYREEKRITLKDGDVLMMEGIHALNPELIPSIPKEKTFHIYVSALTALGLDPHNPISTAMNRLIRRMVRDHSFRGDSSLATLQRWKSVRQGEEKWIFPYQENADAMFNSSMIYELGALKPFAEPLLNDVPQNAPEYADAQMLLNFLKYLKAIPLREIPRGSLLREFLGGSAFKY